MARKKQQGGAPNGAVKDPAGRSGNVLEGLAFISFRDDGRTILREGVVVGQVVKSIFLVEHFTALPEDVSPYMLVRASDMMTWAFFDTIPEMSDSVKQVRGEPTD